MAGVYIKGLEMPTDCDKCPLLDYEVGFCLASGVKGKNGWYESVLCPGSIKYGRHEDCPLIPVPDHGDLIDRDALMKEMERVCLPDSLGATIGFGAAKRRIDDAPVVIEGFGKGINVPSKTEG